MRIGKYPEEFKMRNTRIFKILVWSIAYLIFTSISTPPISAQSLNKQCNSYFAGALGTELGVESFGGRHGRYQDDWVVYYHANEHGDLTEIQFQLNYGGFQRVEVPSIDQVELEIEINRFDFNETDKGDYSTLDIAEANARCNLFPDLHIGNSNLFIGEGEQLVYLSGRLVRPNYDSELKLRYLRAAIAEYISDKNFDIETQSWIDGHSTISGPLYRFQDYETDEFDTTVPIHVKFQDSSLNLTVPEKTFTEAAQQGAREAFEWTFATILGVLLIILLGGGVVIIIVIR